MEWVIGFFLGAIWGWLIVTSVRALYWTLEYGVPMTTSFITSVKIWFRHPNMPITEYPDDENENL